jgi:tRNA pseudouridine55 synthase
MSPRRRGATTLGSCIDKPAETSHDVVARVRRATGEGRVGHAGTLDPMATGLLVLLIGPATRLEPYLSAATKSYEAVIAFGTATDTDDAEGTAIQSAPVPTSPDPLRRRCLRTARRVVAGPACLFSDQVRGKAHRVARAGGQWRCAASIRVDEARLLAIDEMAVVAVSFSVSGAYVRACRDIGEPRALHLSACGARSGPLTRRRHALEEVGPQPGRRARAWWPIPPRSRPAVRRPSPGRRWSDRDQCSPSPVSRFRRRSGRGHRRRPIAPAGHLCNER